MARSPRASTPAACSLGGLCCAVAARQRAMIRADVPPMVFKAALPSRHKHAWWRSRILIRGHLGTHPSKVADGQAGCCERSGAGRVDEALRNADSSTHHPQPPPHGRRPVRGDPVLHPKLRMTGCLVEVRAFPRLRIEAWGTRAIQILRLTTPKLKKAFGAPFAQNDTGGCGLLTLGTRFVGWTQE